MRPVQLLIHLVSAPLLFAGIVLATPAHDAPQPRDHDAQIALPNDAARLPAVSPEALKTPHDKPPRHDPKPAVCPCRHRSFLEFLVVEIGPPRWVRVTFATLFVIYWIPFVLNKWLDSVAMVIYWYKDIPWDNYPRR